MKSFTLFALLAATIIAVLGFTQPTRQKQPVAHRPTDLATTQLIFVVRHANTTPNTGNNPNLNAQGQARAALLANIIQDEELGAIYVTNTARSSQTAAPTSATTGVPSTVYPALDAVGLATTIKALNDTSTTLVIAHSNTVPTIITALGGPTFEDLEETSFDHFYAVLLKDGRHVRTVQLRY